MSTNRQCEQHLPLTAVFMTNAILAPKGVCFTSNIEVFIFMPKKPELDEEKNIIESSTLFTCENIHLHESQNILIPTTP